MKKLLLALLAITICCAHVQAQNVEGQIVASQFGQFQVPGIATGSLQFEPATCQVSGGGKNFAAFAVGVPIKIVDSNPALNEIDTPVAVFINSCAVSMSTSYLHATPFYLTSGTGGLQEAINNGLNKGGGPNTIILNQDWYTQVSPGNPASVIAAVKGNTTLGLVDVTTVPYTAYLWSGTQYVAVPAGGGANTPATFNLLKGAGIANAVAPAVPGTDYVQPSGNVATATALFGASALPPGTTSTTQTVGDSTTKVATDAFVIANAGGSVPATPLVLKGSGVAGSSVAATPGTDYVIPSGTAANLSGTPTLPNGTSATTQTVGDSTGKLATDAFVLANAGNQKALNGVSYSQYYAGALAERVNACMADAIALTNGNTTHICDASAETGTTTTDTQINVGVVAGTPYTLYVPAAAQWLGGMTDGTSCTLKQWGGGSIIGKSPISGIFSQMIIGASNTSNLGYVMCVNGLTTSNNANYVHDQGFSVVNQNAGPHFGHATASGIGFYLSGPFYDGTTFDHFGVSDSMDTSAAVIYSLCCSALFNEFEVNGLNATIPLTFLADNSGGINSVYITNSVINHPATGQPALLFSDTSTSHSSNLSIVNAYEETNATDTAVAQWQISGAGSVNIANANFHAEKSNITERAIQIANVGSTSVTISGVTLNNGSGNWTLPNGTVIYNAIKQEAIGSDASGNVPPYNSGNFFNNVRLQLGNNLGSGDLAIGNASTLPSASLTGNNDLAVGLFAGQAMTTASSSTMIGFDACDTETTGGSNVCVGQLAGVNGSTMLSNSTSTFVGNSANASANALTNDTALGYQAQVNASNQMSFGNTSVTQNVFHGDIVAPTIGASTPGVGSFSLVNVVDSVDNTSMSFNTGSGGDSTCPAPLAGTSYLCTKSSGISSSINGAAYSPLGSGGGVATNTTTTFSPIVLTPGKVVFLNQTIVLD